MKVARRDFSWARLEKMYGSSLALGYRPLLFGEENAAAEPYILWRHDVDLELPAVLDMAELEARVGIRSTYFLLLRSWFYNLCSWEGARVVERLRDLGHGLGLHCDLGVPRDASLSAMEVEGRVAADFVILDAAFPGTFDRVVSFHNPPDSVLQREFTGFYSAYQPKFFGDVKYLSDSNRHWREGPPEEWFDPARYPRFSILLHPVIWAYPGETMSEGMRGYLEASVGRRRDMLIRDDIRV
jgi:hypothetical protein